MAQVTCTGCHNAFGVSGKYQGAQFRCKMCRGASREPSQQQRKRNDAGRARGEDGKSGQEGGAAQLMPSLFQAPSKDPSQQQRKRNDAGGRARGEDGRSGQEGGAAQLMHRSGRNRGDFAGGRASSTIIPYPTAQHVCGNVKQVGLQEARVRGGVTFTDMVAQCRDFIHMVWPATRVLAGTRVCRQLRDLFGGEEPLHLNATLQMKISCTSADIASMNLNRFRAVQINLAGIRRSMSDSFRNQTSPRPFLTALLSQLSQRAPAPVSIDLMYSNIDQDAASQLLAKIVERCPRLRELNVSWNSIGVCGLEEIGNALAHCPEFQILKLGGNELGTHGARIIAQIIARCSSLKTLDVHNNLIGPEGAAAIASALPRCPELAELGMSDNFCGREGAASFAAVLPSCKRLQKLDLWNCRVGNEGSLFLSRALSSTPSLRSLTLRGNAIGDEGGEALAEAVAQSVNLQHLDLRTNKLGDRTAVALAASLQASRAPSSQQTRGSSLPEEPGEGASRAGFAARPLQLNLEHNRIEDDGAIALARALSACPGLLKVSLSRNLIGEVGRAELLAAYPCADTAAKALNLWEAEGLLRARRI